MELSESIDTVLAEGTTLTDRVYEMLFERHPEARALFDKTHMRAQSVMLSAASQARLVHGFVSFSFGIGALISGRERLCIWPRDIQAPNLPKHEGCHV